MIEPAVILRAQFDEDNNRVRLDVAPGSAADYLTVEVQRASGGCWDLVWDLLLAPVEQGGQVTLFDYEAPLNTESQYRALPYETRDSLLFCASEYSNVVSVTPMTKWAI